MAFMNEFIPSDDVVKYGIEAIDESYSKFTSNPHWTVDRERDIYLRQVSVGKEEFANRSTFTFYWNGSLITVILDTSGGELPTGELCAHYVLGRIDLPTELLGKREVILADLKDALTVRNENGVRTLRAISKITFNF